MNEYNGKTKYAENIKGHTDVGKQIGYVKLPTTSGLDTAALVDRLNNLKA